MSSVDQRANAKRTLRFGEREVRTIGVATPIFGDFYHHAMTLSWPAFFASVASVFFTLNLGFAALYVLGEAPVANAHPGFADLFFFSIETLATVGYGDMHPQTLYGHTVATVEIFTGMSILAVMTGLVFARFSRPRARVLFSEVAAIGVYDGRRTLMLRIANARGNTIVEAQARLWMTRQETTKEGQSRRRFIELPLERAENPLFALSWTIYHVVDEASPLRDMEPRDFDALDVNLVLTCSGLDETFGQRIQARRTYFARDLRFDARYVEILDIEDTGRVNIDYRRFHDTEPDAA